MTLDDISRLLKIAKVPRSKVIQWGYPNPGIVVHIDASHLPVVAEVINRMRLKTDNIIVTMLESRDVAAGEHMYVRVKGETKSVFDHNPDNEPEWIMRRQRMKSARLRNAQVVIDCLSRCTVTTTA